MAHIAAVIRNRDGTCTVLKCQAKDTRDGGKKAGSIIERIYVPTYGQGLVKADEIEGKV